MSQPQEMQERYEGISHLYRIRHSAAHVMAQAVLEFYPETSSPSARRSRTVSTMISTCRSTITPEDLEKIEKRMRQIIAGEFPS